MQPNPNDKNHFIIIMQMKLTKVQVHKVCESILEERIHRLRKLSEEAQKAANEETKSSVGDKYETTRAMMQGEKDRLNGQLNEAYLLKKVMDGLQPQKRYEKVQLGSLVEMDGKLYYLGPSLGTIKMGEESVFVISTISPIGKVLLGKKAGEYIEFNGKKQQIRVVN